jgi:RecG-like helicase
MDKIISQYQALVRLHNTFYKAIKGHQSMQRHHQPNTYDYEASLASLTKHFELYYMLLSSYLHEYLHRKYQANIKIKIKNKFNAKLVLHQCFKHKIISAHETAILRSMHPVYEMSKHIYDTDIAEEVSAAIPQYYTALGVLLPRIAPDTLR